MARSTYTGIDIGASGLKLATCADGVIKKITVADVPENLVRDGRILSPEIMAGVLQKAAANGGISCKNCCVSLPSSVSFFRRLTMPAMDVEQLQLNLPYEFRDYITQDKAAYFYDYSVVGILRNENGEPKTLDLMACATEKQTIAAYNAMLRRAGMKLRVAIPEEFCYSVLLRNYEEENPSAERREYAILDLGHSATRIHFYTGSVYETTRVIESGGAQLDEIVAEQENIDIHAAHLTKLSGRSGVLTSEQCVNLFQSIAVEIMRAVNFYHFNNPESTLRDLYLCGGGAMLQPLCDAIAATSELALHPITELLFGNGAIAADMIRCPVAIGAAGQGEGNV
ncbi:MAG: pilus assembly protein PilM [Oscillospiraceae bacterium]|nr:pilus assembly protein PilM [Oscillospiraceae bacterium]